MNSGCRSARGGVSRGFTLIETVLAISISALVMFGGVALLFDMSKLSESLEMGGSLKSHADGVEGFLRSAFSTSSVQSSGDLGETFASNSDKTDLRLEKSRYDRLRRLAFGVRLRLRPPVLRFSNRFFARETVLARI